jgi:hypothetical protein
MAIKYYFHGGFFFFSFRGEKHYFNGRMGPIFGPKFYQTRALSNMTYIYVADILSQNKIYHCFFNFQNNLWLSEGENIARLTRKRGNPEIKFRKLRMEYTHTFYQISNNIYFVGYLVNKKTHQKTPFLHV